MTGAATADATIIGYSIRAIWHGIRGDDEPKTRTADINEPEAEPPPRPADAWGVAAILEDGTIDIIREWAAQGDASAPWVAIRELEAGRPIRTAEQDEAIQRLYNRNPDGARSLDDFARRWVWESNRAPRSCLLAVWCGMTIGIEPDGYTHS